MRISTFMIAILFVGMFATGFTIFYADVAVNYDAVNFSNTTFSGYDQLVSVNNNLKEVNKSLTGIKQETGIVDILGGFLASGYNVIKLTFSSFDAFTTMAETASDQVLIGSLSFMKDYFIAIVFVLFAFAVVTILVGREP